MLLHIVVLLSLIPSIRAICNRTCGAESVPYPFGFSSECKILLTCDAADRITIGGGDFQIRNITSDGILVDVRPYCNRQLIPAVQLFYGGNYAISSKTVLLVRNCSGGRGSPSECVIPTSLLAQQFDLGTCGGPGGDNVTCLSAPRRDAGFLTLAEIEAAGCVALFTAIGYESGDAQYLPSLVFRTVEIGWWLDGECRCAEDADCVTVANPANGSAGFRCACRKGFQGDGFADGDGCRRETDPSCNTSKYISGNCDGPTRIGLLIADTQEALNPNEPMDEIIAPLNPGVPVVFDAPSPQKKTRRKKKNVTFEEEEATSVEMVSKALKTTADSRFDEEMKRFDHTIEVPAPSNSEELMKIIEERFFQSDPRTSAIELLNFFSNSDGDLSFMRYQVKLRYLKEISASIIQGLPKGSGTRIKTPDTRFDREMAEFNSAASVLVPPNMDVYMDVINNAFLESNPRAAAKEFWRI